MKLTKAQKQWLRKNERMIAEFLDARYEELKEVAVLEQDEDRAKKYKFWARECKVGEKYLKDAINEKDDKPFTGI